MKLYNTLSRSLETFIPQNNQDVTVYTCGPTVYDYPHIGNWYAFIRWDLLVRALRTEGYPVRWVMNITDVGHLVSDADEGEDKLEKGAKREGKTAWEVAEYYGTYFTEGLKRLHFTQPDHLPKATDHIEEQIAIVKTLEEKGYTYRIEDGIYFDVTKFPQYAEFAKLNLEEIKAGARIGENTDKKHPADFALWKFSPAHEKRDMEWDSPWGKGFPGWHIECSAMSMKYLGETLDIHAGGIDHIPVHHTNEIAQSEAATGKQFSKYWIHSNFILVDGKKMSKSLGNFYTLEHIEEKGYPLEAFRLFVLESHYQSEGQFSWDGMDAARARLQKYRAIADLKWQTVETDSTLPYADTIHAMTAALGENLNSPMALATLSGFATEAERTLISTNDRESYQQFLDSIEELLGLQLNDRPDISDTQKQLLHDRAEARKNKDWAASDSARDALAAEDIGVRDTPHGQIWFRLKG